MGGRGTRRAGDAATDTTGFTATGRMARDTAGESSCTWVGRDFTRALRNPGSSSNNALVQPGDYFNVPDFDPTVLVRGTVGVETKVFHREEADLGYYIDQAGGYRETAAEGRTRVRYADGEVRTRGGGFLFFDDGRYGSGPRE